MFATVIDRTSPFPYNGLLGGSFNFYSNFDKTFCKQTVEILIRRCIMQRLAWSSLFANVAQKGHSYNIKRNQ